jgi:bifunctional lysine-specific demethylase and histidyl-hydroxylase NO66
MELARQLATALGDPALLERAKARLGERLIAAGGMPTTGHFRSIDGAGAVTTGSVVRRAPGTLSLVLSNSSEATIHFGDNYVSGPAWIEPALRFIAGATVFVAGDLPGDLSPTDKVDLVARLISEGLLTIVEPTRDQGGDHV